MKKRTFAARGGAQRLAAPARKHRTSAAQQAKMEATKRRLLEATIKVVGDRGFEKTTIDAITDQADVGHGAFYLHFESRQEAFEQALIVLGDGVTESIGDSTRESRGIAEAERRGLQANIEFANKNRRMFRFITEAELFVPAAYKRFVTKLSEGYVRSLQRSREAGELGHFRDDELATVAMLLIGMRRQLMHVYCLEGWTVRPPPPDVVETMLKLVMHGLSPAAELGPPAQKRVQRVKTTK